MTDPQPDFLLQKINQLIADITYDIEQDAEVQLEDFLASIKSLLELANNSASQERYHECLQRVITTCHGWLNSLGPKGAALRTELLILDTRIKAQRSYLLNTRQSVEP